MSENEKQDLNQDAVPFFARYLEGQTPEEISEQMSEEEMEALAGGCGAMTMKYPSDNEEGGSGGGFVTRKYPSDNEEGGLAR